MKKRCDLAEVRALAVIGQAGKLTIEEIGVEPPGPGQVRVELAAAGVCHTDLDVMRVDQPYVLGHEGAGVVDAVGAGVDEIAVGDRVLVSWAMPCGACFQCASGGPHLCERQSPVVSLDQAVDGPLSTGPTGTPRRAFDLGTMATHSVVRAGALWPIGPDLPFSTAAILGCGVVTGFGSVVNVAKVGAGTSVVVIGCGGVGLSVVQAARISGAASIIAVDVHRERLAMAQRFGATTTVVPEPADLDLAGVAELVRSMTSGRGADYAFESTGVPDLAVAPLRMIRHGGTAVQISGTETAITVDMTLFEFDKTYVNPLHGRCSPARDFPRLLELYRRGELNLDEMVTRTYPIEEAQAAFDDLVAGRNAKGVLVLR